MKRKNKESNIVIISFIVAFFTFYPITKLCNDNCLVSALALSAFFSFFNLSIYEFLTGDEFYLPILVQARVKSLAECKNNFDKNYRIIAFTFNFVCNIGVVYIIINESWIFN